MTKPAKDCCAHVEPGSEKCAQHIGEWRCILALGLSEDCVGRVGAITANKSKAHNMIQKKQEEEKQ